MMDEEAAIPDCLLRKATCVSQCCERCGFNAAVNAERARALRINGLVRRPDGLMQADLTKATRRPPAKPLIESRHELKSLMQEV